MSKEMREKLQKMIEQLHQVDKADKEDISPIRYYFSQRTLGIPPHTALINVRIREKEKIELLKNAQKRA